MRRRPLVQQRAELRGADDHLPRAGGGLQPLVGAAAGRHRAAPHHLARSTTVQTAAVQSYPHLLHVLLFNVSDSVESAGVPSGLQSLAAAIRQVCTVLYCTVLYCAVLYWSLSGRSRAGPSPSSAATPRPPPPGSPPRCPQSSPLSPTTSATGASR